MTRTAPIYRDSRTGILWHTDRKPGHYGASTKVFRTGISVAMEIDRVNGLWMVFLDGSEDGTIYTSRPLAMIGAVIEATIKAEKAHKAICEAEAFKAFNDKWDDISGMAITGCIHGYRYRYEDDSTGRRHYLPGDLCPAGCPGGCL